MGIADADEWDALDRQACGYLEYLWENGESKGYAGDALSGMQHFLMTRRRCPGSWRLLTTWGRLELPCRAPPLPALVALALSGLALSQGLQDFAAIVLVAFHCFLRIGEAFAITRQAICLDIFFVALFAWAGQRAASAAALRSLRKLKSLAQASCSSERFL